MEALVSVEEALGGVPGSNGRMRGLVFIYGTEVILRFLASGALGPLAAQHDVEYVVLQTDENRSCLESADLLPSNARVHWVRFYPERFRLWNDLFDVSCIHFSDRSQSFKVRWHEHLRRSPDRGARLERLAQPGVYEANRQQVEGEMGLHPGILSLAYARRPDFIVLPSALLDYMTDDVLQVADALGIPTLLLVSGWDNLSSKGLLHRHPSLIGVWGEQTARHAVEVQNIAPDRVRTVGVPHYERFRVVQPFDRTVLRRALGVPVTGKLIVFGGTFRMFAESELLREIDDAIEQHGWPVHVFYRPHPSRERRKSEEDQFFAKPWRHVTLDQEMKQEDGVTAISERRLLARSDHLARIYQAADALISPMSTVLLEAMLFGLPTMAVAFGDGKHSWSADKMARMSHFKEIYSTPGMVVCRDRTAFWTDFATLMSRIDDVTIGQVIRKSTQQFVYQDDRAYGSRVAGLVDEMLRSGAARPLYDSVRLRPGRRYLVRGEVRRVWARARRINSAQISRVGKSLFGSRRSR